MTTGSIPPVHPSGHRHRWLLVFPFVWQAGCAPLVNDIALRPFGLPFPMAWQMAGIVLTSAVIGWVFRLDARAGVDAEDAALLRATPEPTGDLP